MSENTNSNSDNRTWVDRMFADYDDGQIKPLDMVAHDCAQISGLGKVDVIPDSISILVDFGSGLEGFNQLKAEHIVVLGGNRVGRGGQGRLYVPYSQFTQFMDYLNSLKQQLDANLENLVQRVRSERQE